MDSLKVFTSLVIPANAGVILKNRLAIMVRSRYPRECGGDPGSKRLPSSWRKVIPANAGVILDNNSPFLNGTCYPRECGGDPDHVLQSIQFGKLSPRMRG